MQEIYQGTKTNFCQMQGCLQGGQDVAMLAFKTFLGDMTSFSEIMALVGETV